MIELIQFPQRPYCSGTATDTGNFRHGSPQLPALRAKTKTPNWHRRLAVLKIVPLNK